MSWNTKEINLGKVKESTKHNLQFRWEGDKLEVDRIETSCGCTSPRYENNILSVAYKAGKVPRHLSTIGKMTTIKKIMLYTNQGNFTLSFKATIVL